MLSVSTSTRVGSASVETTENCQDPLLDLINAYRRGLADFEENAPEEIDLANAFADKTYRLPRRALETWIGPARTFRGALGALKMAVDADKNDDAEVCSSMIKAAWGYFEPRRNEASYF